MDLVKKFKLREGMHVITDLDSDVHISNNHRNIKHLTGVIHDIRDEQIDIKLDKGQAVPNDIWHVRRNNECGFVKSMNKKILNNLCFGNLPEELPS